MNIWIVRLRAHLLLATLEASDRSTHWPIAQAERDLRRIQQHMCAAGNSRRCHVALVAGFEADTC